MYSDPMEVGVFNLEEILAQLPEEQRKDFGANLPPIRCEPREPDDPVYVEAEKVFAALPPPKPHQAKQGWSRDWSQVWLEHDQQIIDVAHDHERMNEGKSPKTCIEPFKKFEEVNEHGGRLQWFDLTQGSNWQPLTWPDLG